MRTRSGRGAARATAAVPGGEGTTAARTAAEATVDGRWLVLGRDGRLTAYARTRDSLLRWTETRPGGPEWTGPEAFPAPGLSHVSIAQGPDAYVHLLGRRVRGDGDTPTVDVVHALQYQTGRPVSEWRPVGSPHKDREKAARLGPPVAAVGPSGRVHVLVANAAGGVMVRREDAKGKWEPWLDIKGSNVRGAIAALAHASGRVEALAGSAQRAMRWLQDKADGAFREQPPIPVRIAPGTLSALETAPDRATYYWADEGTGQLVAHRPGGWVIPLGGVASDGPAAVLRAGLDGYDCTVLAHRALDGQVMLAACGTENEQAGLWWSPTGERCEGDPALALDALGRVVLAVIGPDGALRVSRQGPGQGLSLEPAVRV
ncbi:hypothetical protein [Streptomyces sp. SHP 1-2]|uniref:hypothetical protein n=1 Tax=Streptomyces sp. SHP 1-2 TaxID=2769489 RepID=UPI002238F3D4|nr:hypothetical protein [Streptomyces sp. SHP 1-2]MCW5252869.1 hypothetical protein [Streptomyces sp. SHP 1-2]